jgi:hypothetical protein
MRILEELKTKEMKHRNFELADYGKVWSVDSSGGTQM